MIDSYVIHFGQYNILFIEIVKQLIVCNEHIYVNEIQCNNSNLFLQIFQIFQYIYIL